MTFQEVLKQIKKNWLMREDQVASLTSFICSIILLIITLIWNLENALPVVMVTFPIIYRLVLKVHKRKKAKAE